MERKREGEWVFEKKEYKTKKMETDEEKGKERMGFGESGM